MKRQFKTSTLKPEHLDILDEERKRIFKKLAFSSEHQIFLAGGIALAFYLNHRTSVDFDFYISYHFKSGDLVDKFSENLKGHKVNITQDIDDTFYLNADGVSISCFYYRYPLIRTLNTFKGVNISSAEDIAAMKSISIVQRGGFRDFVDIYYLIQKFGLEKLIDFTKEKYSDYDEMTVLKGLIYFQDAEDSVESDLKRIKVFDKSLNWKGVKKYITSEVVKYQKQFIKK